MGETVFILAIFILLTSVVLMFVKFFSTHAFNLRAFNLGVTINRKTIPCNLQQFSLPLKQVFYMDEGKFLFSNQLTVYFHSKIFLFRFFRSNTPFPIRSIGVLKPDNQLEIISKVPLSSVLFYFSLFFVVIMFVSMDSFFMTDTFAVFFVLIQIVVLLFIPVISYTIENNRLSKMIEELKHLIIQHQS